MRENLYERRIEMLRYRMEGLSSSIWMPILAEKYDVSVEAVRTDWKRRGRWMPQITRLNAEENLQMRAELLVNLQETRRLLLATFLNADNSSAKVGALKSIAKITIDELKLRGLDKPIKFEAGASIEKRIERRALKYALKLNHLLDSTDFSLEREVLNNPHKYDITIEEKRTYDKVRFKINENIFSVTIEEKLERAKKDHPEYFGPGGMWALEESDEVES